MKEAIIFAIAEEGFSAQVVSIKEEVLTILIIDDQFSSNLCYCTEGLLIKIMNIVGDKYPQTAVVKNEEDYLLLVLVGDNVKLK